MKASLKRQSATLRLPSWRITPSRYPAPSRGDRTTCTLLHNPRSSSHPDWRVYASIDEQTTEETPNEDPEEEEEDDEIEKEGAVEDSSDGNELFGREKGRKRDKKEQAFDERVIELKRVSQAAKGGRSLSFRAVMVVGDGNGTVGVGNATAKELPAACRKAAKRAKRNSITVHLDEFSRTFPHKQEAKFSGAKVILQPSPGGSGVSAGSSVRTVLEVAGVRNGSGKIINSNSKMNNAKATVKALSMMRTRQDVLDMRDVSLDYYLGKTIDPKDSAYQPDDAEQETSTV